MEIHLYKNVSPNIIVNKNISDKLLLSNCTLLNDTSIESPVLLINANDIESIYNYNYVYIPRFKRYYFINDKIFLNGGIVKLSCNVDVLKSFYDEIKTSYELVERQEKKRNIQLPDTQAPIKSNKSYVTFNISDKITTTKYVLTTTGQ